MPSPERLCVPADWPPPPCCTVNLAWNVFRGVTGLRGREGGRDACLVGIEAKENALHPEVRKTTPIFKSRQVSDPSVNAGKQHKARGRMQLHVHIYTKVVETGHRRKAWQHIPVRNSQALVNQCWSRQPEGRRSRVKIDFVSLHRLLAKMHFWFGYTSLIPTMNKHVPWMAL